MDPKGWTYVMTEEQIEDELIDWSRYQLQPDTIPEQYRKLAAMAQLWGTVEPGMAGALIQRAPEFMLKELNEKVRPFCSALNEWLAAPNALPAENWREYSAYSNLRLAADLALAELENRKIRGFLNRPR